MTSLGGFEIPAVKQDTCGMVDLSSYIADVACLNADSKSNAKSVFTTTAGLVKSDTDAQLLLFVTFKEPVKIKSISFYANELKDDKLSGPKGIKLFVGKPNLDFSDVDSTTADQAITLKKTDLEGKDQTLKLTKFSGVKVLTIFVDGNQGGTDSTGINRIALNGFVSSGMNLNNLKKTG
eukprot:TRINITY_DN472_c0_g1_i1.p1 TRINITY_DN472_c0_g1~~TRINITY_DN472_c0_g1_i1.p1  ORF type:complete len:179 (-),score=39.04 TRINITY_DN472_c0_g1_i1:577-1113(-)